MKCCKFCIRKKKKERSTNEKGGRQKLGWKLFAGSGSGAPLCDPATKIKRENPSKVAGAPSECYTTSRCYSMSVSSPSRHTGPMFDLCVRRAANRAAISIKPRGVHPKWASLGGSKDRLLHKFGRHIPTQGLGTWHTLQDWLFGGQREMGR